MGAVVTDVERARQRVLHNKLVGPNATSFVNPIVESGGLANDIMTLTESVVVGVMTAASSLAETTKHVVC